MRCQVKHDVDVTLVEAEVESGGVQVVQISEIAALHHRSELPHCRVVLKGVTHHQGHSLLLGGLDHGFPFLHGGRQGLLNQHVNSARDGLERQRGMQRWRCSNHHRVHLVQCLAESPVAVHARIHPRHRRTSLITRINHAYA